jgi:hypothetical protein
MNQHVLLDPRKVAAALNGEVCRGNEVLAPGPGHSPADRSMSILVDPTAPDGFVVNSFANDDPLACKDYINGKLGRPTWRPKNGSSSRVVSEYIYKNEYGQPHLKVARTSTKEFFQSRWTGSDWKSGTKGITPLPYRLPELLASTGPIFVCEGEKDADRLTSLGFTATTNAMGAGKWRGDLNRWFEGRTVFILPDNDAPGRDHAEEVAHNLHGIAQEVRIVDLPGLPPKGDVSDWFDADDNGEAAGILLDIADSAPLWEPKPEAKEDARKKSPRIGSAADLRRKQFPAIRYIVDGYIAEGCTLLAGRPKLGKSWLMLDVGIAVAAGRYCLGETKCEQGEVLYLALEDNERRLQSRIDKVLGAFAEEWPDGFKYATEWPRANEGGIEEIRRWILAAKNPRLVVVDVLAMFRPTSGNRDNQYEADYAAIKGLQALASEFHIAIVIVHHTRKAGSDVDPFEKVSGTLGLSGAADTVLVLDRDGSGATLYGRGRDVEEVEVAVEFDKSTCRWRILGQAVDVRRTDERSKILSVLIEADEPLTPADIAVGSGMSRNNVDQLLFKMAKAGEVLKAGRGRYIHPDRSDLIEVSPVSPHKKDKKIRNGEASQVKGEEEGSQEPFLSSYRSYRGVEEPRTCAAFADYPEMPDFLRRTKEGST